MVVLWVVLTAAAAAVAGFEVSGKEFSEKFLLASSFNYWSYLNLCLLLLSFFYKSTLPVVTPFPDIIILTYKNCSTISLV